MLKNIKLSAEEALIKAAHEKAQKNDTTLNDEFRRWLNDYIKQEGRVSQYHHIMKKLSYAYTTHTFSSDEMNER